MALSTAMFASVTGLNSASTAISVIGDNIANVSTPGFKERRTVFADVLGQSVQTLGGGANQTGSGAQIFDIGQVFSQGTIEASGRSTDLAIDGEGFFIVQGESGRAYTRAGTFQFDNQGQLAQPNGSLVQGFSLDPVTFQPTGALGNITLSDSVAAPIPTSEANLSVNLSASTDPLVGPFDPADPNATSDFLTTMTVYDSLGTAHQSTIYFTRTGTNAWEYNATLPGATSLDPVVVQGSGTLTFDTDGRLTAQTGGTVTYNFPGPVAANQTIDIDFGTTGAESITTQFAGPASSVNSLRQNGFGPGTMTRFQIDRDGFITASFSNGITRPIAQVALATFPSLEGLEAAGGNSFVETRGSGQPIIGGPETGRLGSIRSGNLEQSTVDLAEQFIRLILNQRAFQANTRTVSTTNELLANLVQLGQ